jgi:hypothetical protein
MERRPTTPRFRGNLTGHGQPSDSVSTGEDSTGSGPHCGAVFPRHGDDRRPAVLACLTAGGPTPSPSVNVEVRWAEVAASGRGR